MTTPFLNRWYVRYGLAVLVVAIALLVRAALVPAIGAGTLYIVLYPSVIIAALTLGAGPGVFAAMLGVVLVEAFFVDSMEQFRPSISLAVRWAIPLLSSLYVGWVGERLRALRAQADTDAAAARSSEQALRRQVELIDSARANIIAQEMQRILLQRSPGKAPPGTEDNFSKRISLPAGILVTTAGIVVLTGWIFDVDIFKRIWPGLVTMKANTALCFLLAGLALLFREQRSLRMAFSGAVCIVGALTLAEYLLGLDFGIDQLLFRDSDSLQTSNVGRMAPATAISFVFAGIALLFLKTKRNAFRLAGQALALATGIIGMVAVIGYLYCDKWFYSFAGGTSVALHTSISLVALATGLIFAREDGLGRVLMIPSPGAQLARGLLPTVLLVPPLLGWLFDFGKNLGFYSDQSATALFALSMMFSLAALVLWTAIALTRVDASRRESEIEFRNQAQLMDQSRDALIIGELDGVILFWNRGAETLYGWTAVEAIDHRIHVLLRSEGLTPGHGEQLLRDGHWEGTLTHTARDGRRVIVECRKTAVRSGDGRILVLQSNRDITERRQTEDALQESEERYRTLFDSMTEGFAIHEIIIGEQGVPVDYRFMDVNPSFERLTGLKRSAIIGRTHNDIMPSDDPRWLQMYGQVALTGQAVQFDNYSPVLKRHCEVFVYRPAPTQLAVIFMDITERKKSEATLKESERRERERAEELATLLDTAPTAIFIAHDTACIHITGNRAADELLRNPRGAEASLLAAPDMRPRHFMAVKDGYELKVEELPAQKAANGEPVHNFEFSLVFNDGTTRHVLGHAEPLLDDGGRPRGAVQVLVDVTEQKRTEEVLRASKSAALNLMEDAVDSSLQVESANMELRESDERLKRAQVIAHLGSWELDLVHNRLSWSDEVYRIFGLQPQELVATYEAFLERIHPDDRAAVDAAYSRSLQDGADSYEIEHRVIRRDTNAIRVVQERCQHIRNAGGNIIRSIGMVHDITDRKQAEQELLRFNRTLKALVDSDQAMMRAVEEAAYLRDVCRIVVEDCGHPMVWIGYAEQDAARSIRAMASAGFEEGYIETLDLTWADTDRGRGPTGACIRSGQVCECRNMLTDPSFLPWREQAVKRGYASSIALPLISEGATIGALTIYFKDPDSCSGHEAELLMELANDLAYGIGSLRLRKARAHAEEELRATALDLARSNRDLEQFAYATSHDLKEPLRMVTGFLGLLKDRYGGKLDGKANEYIGFAADAATRMQRLIDDLLAYARVGRGKEQTAVDTNTVVVSALANLQRSILESGAVITQDPLPVVQANALEMAQLFQNLIGNAIKFRKPGIRPEIHIGAKRVTEGEYGRNWIFSITDNGIGIDLKFSARLFKIFQRLHTHEEYPGSGVGLAICKKIVEQFGGEIWVESRPGSGSMFCFTIPDVKKE